MRSYIDKSQPFYAVLALVTMTFSSLIQRYERLLGVPTEVLSLLGTALSVVLIFMWMRAMSRHSRIRYMKWLEENSPSYPSIKKQ